MLKDVFKKIFTYLLFKWIFIAGPLAIFTLFTTQNNVLLVLLIRLKIAYVEIQSLSLLMCMKSWVHEWPGDMGCNTVADHKANQTILAHTICLLPWRMHVNIWYLLQINKWFEYLRIKSPLTLVTIHIHSHRLFKTIPLSLVTIHIHSHWLFKAIPLCHRALCTFYDWICDASESLFYVNNVSRLQLYVKLYVMHDNYFLRYGWAVDHTEL